MMNQDIQTIYYNNFGIAFRWKEKFFKKHGDIQIVFRDMGFYVTANEVHNFYTNIHNAKKCLSCQLCVREEGKRSILLKTPTEKVDIVVNQDELKQIEDLIEGTLFQLKLDDYIEQLCKY